MSKKKIILLTVLLTIGIVCYFIFKNRDIVEEATTDTFMADIYLYTKEEGGRITSIDIEKYHPQFEISNTSIFLKSMKGKKEKLSPGEKANIKVILQKPIFLKKGDTFILKEGEKVIGNGTITEIIN